MDTFEENCQIEWDNWGDIKPWYCPKCNSLLASNEYNQCDGTDSGTPEEYWKPHEIVKAAEPISFEKFCEVQRAWEKDRLQTFNSEDSA